MEQTTAHKISKPPLKKNTMSEEDTTKATTAADAAAPDAAIDPDETKGTDDSAAVEAEAVAVAVEVEQAQEEAELIERREKKEASEELTKRLQKLALDRQKVRTRINLDKSTTLFEWTGEVMGHDMIPSSNEMKINILNLNTEYGMNALP